MQNQEPFLRHCNPLEREPILAEYSLPGEETDREAFVQKLIQGGYQETA